MSNRIFTPIVASTTRVVAHLTSIITLLSWRNEAGRHVVAPPPFEGEKGKKKKQKSRPCSSYQKGLTKFDYEGRKTGSLVGFDGGRSHVLTLLLVDVSA